MSRFRLIGPALGPDRRPRRSFEEEIRAALEPGGERGESGLTRRALRRLAGRWRATLRRLAPLGRVSTGNAVELYADGDRLFEALWAEIDGATERVTLTTYILEPDRVGRASLDALARAAGRGCRVTLRYDAVGSPQPPGPELDLLRRLGATVEEFNPVFTWRLGIVRRMVRDHRKVCVVDGRIGFCGGMNLSDDYAGEAPFRDTHLAVRGPAASDLERLFDESVSEPASDDDHPGDAIVQVLESNRWRRRRAIQRALRRTIARAQSTVWLTTPYFVPPRRLGRAIRLAAQRGVDVRLLTAGPSDVPLVRAIARRLFTTFLKSGVRIYELQGRTLHAKTAVIDGVYASVGSFNLDILSDRYNHEVNVGVLDRSVAANLEAHFRSDLKNAVRVTPERLAARGMGERILGWVGLLLSKLL